MLKTACFIPIKKRSTRVPRKNFRLLNGKRLFEYIIEASVKAKCFDSIYVDTDSLEVISYCNTNNINVINRHPDLSKDTANGNDLMNYWYDKHPDYGYYFQLFATSPFTSVKTVRECSNLLKVSTGVYDSILTVHEKCGWYWFEDSPINYNPKTLPRSQDAKKVLSETTALYGITNESLKKNQCRIGDKPLFYFVNDIEAMDIDSEFDFKMAQIIAKEHHA